MLSWNYLRRHCLISLLFAARARPFVYALCQENAASEIAHHIDGVGLLLVCYFVVHFIFSATAQIKYHQMKCEIVLHHLRALQHELHTDVVCPNVCVLCAITFLHVTKFMLITFDLSRPLCAAKRLYVSLESVYNSIPSTTPTPTWLLAWIVENTFSSSSWTRWKTETIFMDGCGWMDDGGDGWRCYFGRNGKTEEQNGSNKGKRFAFV